MKNMIRTILALSGVAVLTMGNSGCSNDAQVASENLSQDADNFRIPRRIVFYNGITDKYMLEVNGYCSIGNGQTANSLAVTCKAEGGYKKHLLGRSDNVTYFVEQLAAKDVSVNFYQVTWKPTTIIPDIRLELGK
jgi:hypothetical protein